MSESILIINAIVAVTFLVLSLFAGHVAGSLAYSKTIKHLRRAARFNFTLLAGIGVLAITKLALIVYRYFYGMPSLGDSLLLFIPLIALPAIAIAVFSVPRLIEIIRMRTTNAYEPANRTKRRSASEVELVVPIQTLTIGALLYALPSLYRLPISFRSELIIAGILIVLLTATLIWRQSVRRRRIHRDNGTSIFHVVRRIGVYVTACFLVTISITQTVSSVELNNQVSASYVQGDLMINTAKAVHEHVEYKWINKTLLPMYEGVTLALKAYKDVGHQ
ncbi:hypothetical protein Back11_62520 [Paenibacillus baekrokdamisoli]|uniref:Uncharacterized protein n=1 Tax=Paenibacillus baekrokdamisoli TaxID=1712516 RepID=A0A3G9J137_9BACL|nr:hypothetical protein [Paenibacillus baekrokdamisoli]MBB3069519.1 hypothetical protein [Paenibacillus baekrokdamisoli]BBH24907.1 hypothetical protein Back11_62520 [Paenibacillus baekrokdamisoli]